MKYLTFALPLLALALGSAASARPITVTIHRITQIDDLDKSTFGFTKDRADFYVQVTINGVMKQSKVKSGDTIRPNWRFRSDASSRYVNIRIKVIDDDGGLERKDDFVDVNPAADKKDLNLRYDTKMGRFTGSVSGRKGTTYSSTGKGDSGRGRLWFSVR